MNIKKTLASMTILAMAATLAPAISLAASHGGNATMKKDTMAKDAMMKKDEMAKDAMKKDAMAKDAMMQKDEMAKDAMKKDAMAKDNMAKDTMKKDAMAKDAMPTDSMKKDTMAKEGMKKDAMMTSHYVIKSGDSLWNIAKSAYGDGAMWTKIMAANENLEAGNLMVGKTINLPK